MIVWASTVNNGRSGLAEGWGALPSCLYCRLLIVLSSRWPPHSSQAVFIKCKGSKVGRSVNSLFPARSSKSNFSWVGGRGGGDPVRGRYAAGNHLAGLSRKHPSVKLDPQRRCASSVLEILTTDLHPPDRAVIHLWLKANSRSLFGKWRQVSTIVESWLYLALDSEIFGAFQKGLEWTEKCPQRPLNMLRVSFGVCGMVDYEICLPRLDFETR